MRDRYIHGSEVDHSGQLRTGTNALQQAYNLFMQAPVAIQILLGEELIIELVNDTMLRLLGKGKDVIGRPFKEVLPELDEQGLIAVIQQVRLTGEPFHANQTPVRLFRNNRQETGYFNFVFQPYFDPDGAIIGVLVIANEVTEKIIIEKELAEKERSLELAAEIGELGVFQINLNDKGSTPGTTTCSQRVMNWFGITEPNLPLLEILSKIHTDDQSSVSEMVEGSIAGEWGGRHHITYRVIDPKDGAIRFLCSTGQVQFENAVPVSISGIIQDVTPQVLASNTIEESEQRIRSLIESAPFPIGMFTGREMRIELANQAIMDGWGKGNDVVGKLYRDVLPELDHQKIFDQVDRVYNTGVPFHAKNQRLSLLMDGKQQVYYYNYSFTPLFDASGNVYGIINTGADVTDLNIAKQKVEESEDRFRTMAEGTEILISVSDETPRARYFNKAWADLTGRPVDELLRTGWGDLVHPDDRQRFLDSYINAFKKRESFTGEFRVLNKNGEYRWLLAKLPARFRPDGSFAGFISSCVDITERKQAEEALMENELHLRTVINSNIIGILFWDSVNARITDANAAFFDIVGYSREELLSGQVNWLDVTPPEFKIRDAQATLELNGPKGKCEPYEKQYIAKDGRRVDILIGRAVYKGKKQGGVAFVLDITDRKKAERALQESERNLRNVILQAPVAMCIVRGPDFVVEIANSLMLTFWGRSGDDIINKSVFDALTEAREQGFESLLNEVYTTGKTFTGNGLPITLTRNGKIDLMYMNLVFEALREADGSISGVIAVVNEVTEQVLAHNKIEEVVEQRTKELAKANLQLQQSNTELNQFAFVASHDLQEPLRKVRTFAGLIESALPDEPGKVKTYLNSLQVSVQRMQALINDVLQFSQLSNEVGKFAMVDLNQVLTQVTGDYELLIEQKAAIITAAHLPAIEAIPLQMSQLFTNLLSNALKYSSEERRLEITIKTRVLSEQEIHEHNELNGDSVHHAIEFTDNGIGFSQEYARKIFTIFQRLHGRTKYEGTGIGLALCRKIVINHHGIIYANAELNAGASFTIILPEVQENKDELNKHNQA